MKTENDNGLQLRRFQDDLKKDLEACFLYDFQNIPYYEIVDGLPVLKHKSYFLDNDIRNQIDASYLKLEELIGEFPILAPFWEQGGKYFIIIDASISLMRLAFDDARKNRNDKKVMIDKLGANWQEFIVALAPIVFDYIDTRDSMITNYLSSVSRNALFDKIK